MVFRYPLALKTVKEDCEKFGEGSNTFHRFTSTQYRNPSIISQRPNRWYNGSLIGNSKSESPLFGRNGRLRSLHLKVTSQETPGSQPRSQLYRLVGDILSQFFPLTILDPLIEEIIKLETLRLPQTMEEAFCIVLAAVEMYLRKSNRMILKEKVVEEISKELGMDIDRTKLVRAKWVLARGDFWKEHLHEINTATYEILQNLALEIIAGLSLSMEEDSVFFRRQLYHRCIELVDYLAKTRRRPQNLEIYAHVIVSLAVESIYNRPFLSSESLEDKQINKRVSRAKRQFWEMLQNSQKNTTTNPLAIKDSI